MKALTIRQPWAGLVAAGAKDVENRTQLWSYTGPLLVHAGGGISTRGVRSPLVQRARAEQKRLIEATQVRSAVIGIVTLRSSHRVHDRCCSSPWAEHEYVQADGARRTDLVHLVLSHARLLAEPIPYGGRLGLWTPPPSLVERALELAEVPR